MRNVALDLGVKKIAYCEIANGQVVAQGSVRRLEELDKLLGAGMPPACVAIEACREAWHVHDELTHRGHDVVLVDTTRVGKLGIGRHGRKTDRIDAEVLARAVESGHIPVAHLLSPARRELRVKLSVRRALVETRAQYVTTVRGLLRARGKRPPSCGADFFVARFREAELDAETLELCTPMIEVLGAVESQLVVVDRELQKLVEEEPVTQVLMSAPGVGVVVAAAFVSVIDEANRFAKAHHVESYLGLVPSEDSSGGKRRVGAISKAGNPYLRALLIQSAWCILRLADDADPLKAWAVALAERRGKRIAVVALARRLAGVLWAMWRDGTFYDPGLASRASVRGLLGDAREKERRAAQLARVTTKMNVFARPQRRHLKEETIHT